MTSTIEVLFRRRRARISTALLSWAGVAILSACTGAGLDLSANFATVSVGDTSATVFAKMGGAPLTHESASLFGFGVAYQRVTYTDVKNQYAVVFLGNTAVATFSTPRKLFGDQSCK